MLTEQEILEVLSKYCDFTDLCEYNFRDQVIEPLIAANAFTFHWANGVTKLVLMPFDTDFVVKIPFVGELEYDGYEDGLDYEAALAVYGEEGMDERIPRYCVRSFYGANADNDWDYCQAEARISAQARSADLLKYFAETHYIGEANGHPIYVQQKAEIFEGIEDYEEIELGIVQVGEEEREAAAAFRDDHFIYCNSHWMAQFIKTNSIEELRRLDVFCKNCGIEDLHDENIGYIDGCPVLVDYSSYDG